MADQTPSLAKETMRKRKSHPKSRKRESLDPVPLLFLTSEEKPVVPLIIDSASTSPRSHSSSATPSPHTSSPPSPRSIPASPQKLSPRNGERKSKSTIQPLTPNHSLLSASLPAQPSPFHNLKRKKGRYRSTSFNDRLDFSRLSFQPRVDDILLDRAHPSNIPVYDSPRFQPKHSSKRKSEKRPEPPVVPEPQVIFCEEEGVTSSTEQMKGRRRALSSESATPPLSRPKQNRRSTPSPISHEEARTILQQDPLLPKAKLGMSEPLPNKEGNMLLSSSAAARQNALMIRRPAVRNGRVLGAVAVKPKSKKFPKSLQERAQFYAAQDGDALDNWDWDNEINWETESNESESVDLNRGEKSSPLYEVLSDPEKREIFSLFLKQQYSHENLDMYDAVFQYQKLGPEQFKEEAQRIWDQFLAPDAPNEFNCSSTLKRTVQENIREPNQQSFDPLKKHAFQILSSNFYAAFIQSQPYLDYVNQLKSHGGVEMGGFKSGGAEARAIPMMAIVVQKPEKEDKEPNQLKESRRRPRSKSSTPTMTSYPSPSPPVNSTAGGVKIYQQGLLYRWSGTLWKKNYAALDSKTLFVYKKEGSKELISKTDLGITTRAQPMAKYQGKDACFMVTVPPHAAFIFSTGSVFETSQWLRNLRTVLGQISAAAALAPNNAPLLEVWSRSKEGSS